MSNERDSGRELERATLGGGCFWCLEPIFKEIEGVKSVSVGYAGGSVPNPSYRQVTTGTTGHAEVAQIEFDPDEVSYADLLRVFFTIHDPTTLNRQGPDVGPQYRSIILFNNQEQRETAEQVMGEIEREGLWDDPLVTELEHLDAYYPAEDYHQEYYENNPNQPYCRAIIAPKVAKFRQKYQDRLKAD